MNYVDESDEPKHEIFDLIVLAAGQAPPKKAKEIGGVLGVELDGYGFCKPVEVSAVGTTKPGVFVCGSFSGPKDIPDTIIEASACAAMASSLLSKPVEQEKEMVKKAIDEDSKGEKKSKQR